MITLLTSVQLDCQDIVVNVRGRHRMAYPIKDYWEGNYVIFRYIAGSTVPPQVQCLLSAPQAGAEGRILRHGTFRY
jgi:ribosomal protein S6